MSKRVEVKLNMRGVRRILSDPAVVARVEEMAEAIASEANAQAASLVDTEYERIEPFEVVPVPATREHGLPGFLVAADQRMHSGDKKNPGPAIGDVLQAEHSVLTKAIDAGRGA